MTNIDTDMQHVAEKYADYFRHLKPESIGSVHGLIAEDIHFVDPFNDVKGRADYTRVVEKMFEDVRDPKFDILDLAWSGEMCLMRWDFSCEMRFIGDWTVRGVTEIQFDEDCLVAAHYDYWDASRHFYSRLPIVGSLIRLIQKKAQI